MRHFTTTSTKRWNLPYATALRVAGPAWPMTTEKTEMNSSSKSDTAKSPLPLGLTRPVPHLPKLNMALFNPELMANNLWVPDAWRQPTVNTEGDVISDLAKYNLQAALELAPDYLVSLGFNGRLSFSYEHTKKKSRIDCLISYSGKPIISFDFKGPNCVRTGELDQCSVTTVEEANKLIQSRGQTLRGAQDDGVIQGPTLLRTPGVSITTERLIQSAFKYRSQMKSPLVMFYDVDCLVVTKPWGDMTGKNEHLMETFVFTEPEKSTKDRLVELEHNHLAVIIQYIVKMVQEVESSQSV